MKSSKLITELTALENRREALAAETADAAAELEAARTNLIAGSVGVAEVTAAQSTFTTLTEALGSVDAQLSELHTQLSDAQATEAREANMRAMADLAAAGNKAFADYQQVRAEADAALLALAERLIEGQAAVQRQRERFLELFSTFCPHAAMGAGWANPNLERMRAEDAAVARLLNELRERGADLAAVTSSEFGASSQIDTLDLQQRTVADEPLVFAFLFRQLINTAEQVQRQARIAAEGAPARQPFVAGRSLPRGWDSKTAA